MFKKVQQEVKKAIKRAKRNVEKKLAKNRKTNSKGFFSGLKKNISNRVSVGPQKVENEVFAASARMASILNTWYCFVFTDKDVSNIPEVENLFKEGEQLETVEITSEKVEKKLKQLKPTAAPDLGYSSK